MPKPRLNINKGLPTRWSKRRNAYYYSVPKGKEALWDGKTLFRLGSTLSEAYRVYADRVEISARMKTIGDILERYLLEVIPEKSAGVQRDAPRQVGKIKAVFGHMLPEEIKPHHIYQYHDKSKKKVAARHEIAHLSSAFTYAIRWGVAHSHPIKGKVVLPKAKPRDRYVEDWEVIECLSLQPTVNSNIDMIKAYICLKLLTGLSKKDLLLMESSHLTDEGIETQRHKTRHSTGKRTLYEWTPHLRQAVDAALAVRPVDISPYIFCDRFGKPLYRENGTASNFGKQWNRFMKRALAETRLEYRFTEHDLRAKVGSDAISDEAARGLLSHSTTATTKRVYRRKAERVKVDNPTIYGTKPVL